MKQTIANMKTDQQKELEQIITKLEVDHQKEITKIYKELSEKKDP
ncbi:hypothetical protein N9189_02040 [Pirellulaceae bacterium]|nr:hypothetical protein [Pirellulaceae bacterium]